MSYRLPLLTLAIALLATAPASAAIKPGSYSGKSDGGYDMAFTIKGKKVSRLSGMVPASCVSPTGGTTAGGEVFKPPGKFTIGKTRKVSAKQGAAMHYSKVTKNYRVALKKTKRGFRAKLHVNFSFQTIDYSSSFLGPRLKTWVCRGDDSFNVI